jgi:hypothetical protein
LEDVVADPDFWGGLRAAAVGSALLTENQRATLERLSGSDLTAMLEALQYTPPPPVEAFVEDTMDAIGGVLETDLSAEVRAARVRELEFELISFVMRLRRLLGGRRVTSVPARRRLPNILRRGSKIALSLGVAAAGIASEAGLLALGANPNIAKFGGKTGELVATAAAQQVQRLLPEHEAAELELAITLDAIDPTARARAFLRLLENTIAHAAASEQVTDEAVDRAEVQLARLERAAERAGNRSRELDGALQAVAGDLQAARATLAAAPTPAAQEALRDALDQCRQAWQAMQGERMGMYRIVAPGGVRLSTDDLQRVSKAGGAGREVLDEHATPAPRTRAPERAAQQRAAQQRQQRHKER